MRTFFLSVFLASLAGALSVAFAGGGAYEKYIKYIVIASVDPAADLPLCFPEIH